MHACMVCRFIQGGQRTFATPVVLSLHRVTLHSLSRHDGHKLSTHAHGCFKSGTASIGRCWGNPQVQLDRLQLT